MTQPQGRSDHRTQTLGDALVVFLLVFWVTIGVLVGAQVWSISKASDAAKASARAVDQAGQALQQLSRLPLVPDGPGQLGREVRAAAADVRTSSDDIRRDLRQLSILLGITIALVPTTPVLAFYVPSRMQRRRQRQALQTALADRGLTAELEAVLAHGAVANLDYRELTTVSADPVGDLAAGRHRALAVAEADRLGLVLPTSARDGT